MSPIAQMVQRMLAAGVAADMIVLAIETAEASTEYRQSTQVDRRAYQRDWARNKRAAARTTPPQASEPAASSVDKTSTVETVDTALYPRKVSSNDVSIERKKESKRVRARARQQLPDGWRPDDLGAADHSEFAEFERFCDHARANGRLCADWTAAWRNWKRKAPEFAGRGRVNGHRLPRPGSWEDRQEKTANALAKLDQYLARDADEPRSGGHAGEAPDGRLPFDKPA